MVETRRLSGFTLVELLMVVTIVGVLAVTAIPRFFDRGAFDERGYLDSAKSALRHARAHAIATGCDVQVTFTAAGLAVRRRASCESGAYSVPVAHPATPDDYVVATPPSLAAPPAATIHFDHVGRPRDAADAPLAVATTLTIGSRSIVVEAETGYAHAD